MIGNCQFYVETTNIGTSSTLCQMLPLHGGSRGIGSAGVQGVGGKANWLHDGGFGTSLDGKEGIRVDLGDKSPTEEERGHWCPKLFSIETYIAFVHWIFILFSTSFSCALFGF